jgi:nicotinate-nucleotide--dimethylbenzimidazole phosphoribosyltransferase
MILLEALQKKINGKTKPVGALGQLEKIALQVGLIQNTLSPVIYNPHLVVFAGDHGIAAGGKVNPYPQAVTAQMVLNFVAGGAAVNVFCRQHQITLQVVDAGVNYDFEPSLPILHAKIKKGTSDYSKGNAMTMKEAVAAISTGKAVVEKVYSNECNTIALGEMGIGNTSSAALIMHHLLRIPIEQCVGRGTGATDIQLENKKTILHTVSNFHQLNNNLITAMELLCKVGGFEIAMMAGAYIKAYELGMVIVVDGFITTAALLLAIELLNPGVQQANGHSSSPLLQHCIFAHTSGEQGHEAMLHFLQATPLLQLNMRLGEGTGAALAIPIIKSAIAFLNEMSSFEEAGVSANS